MVVFVHKHKSTCGEKTTVGVDDGHFRCPECLTMMMQNTLSCGRSGNYGF